MKTTTNPAMKQWAPPARRAVEPHQACALRGQAVRGDQLLLLADRAGEAERVRAETDQPDHSDQRQAQRGSGHHTQALARGGEREQERQRQPGGDLDRDPVDQRGRAGAKARAGAGGEQQCGGQRQQQQRVVVVAADGQLEQHRVQAHEGGRRARAERPSAPSRAASSAIAARLVATASVFNAHSPPASPSGAIA